jgi:hypothetical protein
MGGGAGWGAVVQAIGPGAGGLGGGGWGAGAGAGGGGMGGGAGWGAGAGAGGGGMGGGLGNGGFFVPPPPPPQPQQGGVVWGMPPPHVAAIVPPPSPTGDVQEKVVESANAAGAVYRLFRKGTYSVLKKDISLEEFIQIVKPLSGYEEFAFLVCSLEQIHDAIVRFCLSKKNDDYSSVLSTISAIKSKKIMDASSASFAKIKKQVKDIKAGKATLFRHGFIPADRVGKEQSMQIFNENWSKLPDLTQQAEYSWNDFVNRSGIGQEYELHNLHLLNAIN